MKTLRELYQKHSNQLAQFAHSFADEDLQGPLLTEPTEYFEQPTKLLVIGQETRGWLDKYDDIEAQLDFCRGFNMGENAGGPFWSITRKIESALGIKRCACAWTNLNRFGHDEEAPTGAVLEAMSSLDFLVREEIRILQPDVCLFFTNRKNDSRIEALFPGVKFSVVEGLQESHFARLTHADLPGLTLRTPHPKWMRMNGWEEPLVEFLRSQAAGVRHGRLSN